MSDKKLKDIQIKFIFILLLSNISVYLISLPSTEEKFRKDSSPYRINYIPVKIRGKLHTVFSTSSPFQLISKDQKLRIKNVFLLKQINDSLVNSNDFGKEESYIVHMHSSDLSSLVLEKEFNIYPHQMQLKAAKPQGRKYEVIF